ncbi:MAG TPA: ABC-2 family transporter protein [Pseudonocardiaceae bacterium]|nr:ABC-2 family transporter protein [Pseudonocardiaceae bacterium]
MADAPVRARLAAYRRLAGAAVRAQLAYPGSFALQCVGQALAQAGDLVAVLVLFGHITAMAGFATHEVLLMYGIAGIAFGLADGVVGQLDGLPTYIRTGALDALLLRPLSALGQLCASDIALRRLGRIATGLVVLVYALVEADITWTAPRIVLAVTAPLTGAVVLSAVWVVACSVCFWVVEGRELANSVTYGSSMFTAYPLGVFGPWLRRLMGFAVPGAFVAYFPTLALLGKPDPLGLPALLQWSSPVVAALAVLVAGGVWRLALRHYQGTGS